MFIESAVQAVQALTPLADKLGTTAEYLWRAAVHKEYIEGLIAVWGAIGVSIMLWTAAIVYGLRENEWDSIWIAALIQILPVILFLLGLVQMLAPEGEALQTILQSMK